MNEKTDLMKELLSQINIESIDKDTITIIAEPYKKILYTGLSYLFDCYKDLAENKELFEVQAKYEMNKLNAYMNAGFTREEAFSLVMKSNVDASNFVKGVSTNVKSNK